MSKRIPFLGFALAFVGFSGCIVEKGHGKCDENQRLLDGFCVCVDGAVPADEGYGCRLCGDNQTVVAAECVCDEGFVSTPSGSCVEAPEGLGAPCDPDANACPDEFAVCHTPRDGAPLCTKECTENADCDEPFGCSLSGNARVCLPAPGGLYAACESEADCDPAGASYCSITDVCLERDCSADRACWGGSVCCDYTGFGAPTVCVPVEGLENGACYLDVPQIEPKGGGQ